MGERFSTPEDVQRHWRREEGDPFRISETKDEAANRRATVWRREERASEVELVGAHLVIARMNYSDSGRYRWGVFHAGTAQPVLMLEYEDRKPEDDGARARALAEALDQWRDTATGEPFNWTSEGLIDRLRSPYGYGLLDQVRGRDPEARWAGSAPADVTAWQTDDGQEYAYDSTLDKVTVYDPDGLLIARGESKFDPKTRKSAFLGEMRDGRRISGQSSNDFVQNAVWQHRIAQLEPGARDKLWIYYLDHRPIVHGTDKYADDWPDMKALLRSAGFTWSGFAKAYVTTGSTRTIARAQSVDRLARALYAQGRMVEIRADENRLRGILAPAAPAPVAARAAALVPAGAAEASPVAAPPETPAAPAAAPPVTAPEPAPEPEPEDLTGLSYEDLVAAEDVADTERSRRWTSGADAAEARYQRLRQERGKRLLDRVTAAAPVTELSTEDLTAENEWWQKTILKMPFHSADESYRTLERRRNVVTVELNGHIAKTLVAGPAAADLDDEALESAHERIGQVWARLPGGTELNEQVTAYRKSLQDERATRRARSYSERTPVGEMTLEELVTESINLGSDLAASNEQSAYSYSDAVKDARAERLRIVDAQWHQRGLEQNPDAARAALSRSITGKHGVLIDGSVRSYGYVERQGKKFRALADTDQRSSIGDFDSGPAAMAALVRRYDQDPEMLPRRTWGRERLLNLPSSAHDPLVSWLRSRPSELSREYDRALTLLTPYIMPTQTKLVNPLTNQVMRAYPFVFEEGLLGELARIAERTTEDLREQSLNEQLPKREREAFKRRIPAMGAALIGINAVIERVRAAGGDVERRGVDQGRLAAQMAALAGTVDEREGGESDDSEQPVRDAATAALGGVPAPGAGGDGEPGPVLPDAGDADERSDRRGGGGPGGGAGAGDGVPGPGRADGADLGDGAGAGPARDAAAAGGRGGPGRAAESGSGGAGGDPQGAGEPVAAERFRPNPADLPRGPLARAEANLEAVKMLRTLEGGRRGATTEEKRVLSRWSGWGSVPTVFLDEPDPDEPIYGPGGDREDGFETDHARWELYSRVRGELRGLLDPFEWRAASRAVLSAHYTPRAVAEAMWQGLAAYGFDGGEVLEAGFGSGVFCGVAPPAARLTGIELDPTTAAIAGWIYPHATVLAESFAETDVPRGTFDAVIGNVPFSQAPFGDRRLGGDYNLHNGFIIKQLGLLRPGAYMTVITSRWTLDGEKSTPARRAMARWGDLAGAYRMPRGTFGESGDTDVVADVLVFRRRAEGEEPGDQVWVEASERELGGHTLAVNAYFTEHPENVLGRMTSEAGPYGPRVTVQGDPDAAPRLLRERMEATAAAAVADGLGYTHHEDWPHREPLFLQAARVKHATDFTGRLYTDDQGQIWQHVNGADPVRVITADGVQGAEQLRTLLSLRDVAGELQELDRTGSDPDRAREVRGQLARLHTAYTDKHGALSRPRQTRLALPTDEAAAAARAAGVGLEGEDRLPTGWGWFRQDPHAAVVLGLEHWDRANDRAVPSEVLTRRPGARRGDLEPTDDPKTALTAVMGATGRVDLPLIASLLGTTAEEARLRLGTEVFDNPVTRKLEHAGSYLSGAVREKLEQAREAAATDPKYAVNVAALDTVQPPSKRLGQFTAQLGAHWIPAPLVQGFLREYLGDPTLQISHNERYGWSLAAGKVPDAINALKGTERRSAVHIAKALLGRASMVVNRLDGDGVDEDATRAMRYKADAMRSAFEDYCTASTLRVTQLTDAYNRQMNGHVVRSYDSLAPTLEGFTTERTPHPWQLSGAARMQFERGVILAHEMGLGKTTTMVMGSQALKASGQIGKPFAVVQPGLGRQWLDEAKLLYPNADIRLITSDDLADDKRRPVLEWLRANSPDLVIFTEGAFGSIRMSPEQQELFIFREIESLKEQLERERGVPHNAFALMKLEQRLATVEARIRRNDAPMRTPGEVYWDDLGFDYACIDEAHRFTAVGFRSKEAGGDSASVRGVDLHQKLTWHHQMAEADGGRPTVTLGTGTPMENSIFEQYSCLELATPWLLDQFGVHGPDLWSETFGQRVQRIEQAPDGSGLTIVERFSRFVSRSTMKTMWGLATDTKTADEVGIERPKVAGGAPELVLVEPTADQRTRLQSLVVRGQAIHAGDVTREKDNMLAVSGEGRAVALDPRLVDADAPGGNKLVQAADIIAAGYHAHKDHTYSVSSRDDTPHPVPGGLFFVFANSGTPGGNNKGGFDAYAELRDLLATRGVPPDLVQFAQEHRTPERKAEMTKAANNGGIAVLMGSSEVLGTGVNAQNRAYALMHLDQDWTPAMMMQRNARALRPGNQHEEVSIYFLATKGSMDAWQVGLLTSKAEGLRDIQRPPGVGDDEGDTVEEIGASDWDYATMAAEIGGNPYMRQFMEARVHLQGLEADRRNAAADRVRQTELLGTKEGELAGTRGAIEAREKALPKITETIRGDAFCISIGGREFEKFGEAAAVLRQAVNEAVRAHQNEGIGPWKKLGTFGGLDFAVQPEIAHGSGEIRAYIGFPELRHSESRCSVEDLLKGNIGATMLGRLATALEKAEDHQLMDRERLPGLEKEVAVLTAQQEAVNYGPAIEHARRRVELLDGIVGAITERDKIPELTESMLDPKKHPTENSRKKALKENAERRTPHQANVDAAAMQLATFDAENPAPEPVQLVNTWTEDNDTDEAFEQWREQQRTIVQQNREAGLGASISTDEPAPAPEDGAADADAAAAEPDSAPGEHTAGQAPEQEPGGDRTEEPAAETAEPPGDGYGTADLYDEFGLTQPDRVPAPAPKDEPEPETEDIAGVPVGQMTVDEEPEAAFVERDAVTGDDRGLTAAAERRAADLNAAAVLRHYEPLLSVAGLSGADAVSYLSGEMASDDAGQSGSESPFDRLMDDIGRRADRVGGLSQQGRAITMRDVSGDRNTLHRHLVDLTLGVSDVRQGREQQFGIDLAGILAAPNSRFSLPDTPQWRLAAVVPNDQVVVAHDPETGYAVFNTYRRRKAGEVLRAQGFQWNPGAVPEGVWQPRSDQPEDKQHQSVRALLDALAEAGVTHAAHGQMPGRSVEPIKEMSLASGPTDTAGVSGGQAVGGEAQPGEVAAGPVATVSRGDGRERLTSADGRLTFTLHVVPADVGFHQEAVDGYQRRRDEVAAVVEAKNGQATQTRAEQADQLDRWRQTYKTANGLEPLRPLPSLRLTRQEDAPGLIPAEYGIGSWVTWHDSQSGQQVTGQVMSPGAAGDTWYVSTDRTGVTGEYHVLSRSGKKATGYTYALNGAAADLLPADGPVEQSPFEDLPPVDSVPAQPLTSYADYVPGEGLAVVREPIAVTVGEITSRGPELVFDVLADGVPFVVRVTRHNSSGVQIFTPRIEIDGETVRTFGRAESRGGAVEICERVVREAREDAAEPLRTLHRVYDFTPAAAGRCGRYNLHTLDTEPQPLYHVGDSEPLCIEHVVSTFGVEMSEVSKLARAHQIWGTRMIPEPAAAAVPGTPPADVEQPEEATAQETAAATASQDPHEVAREALQGGNRITVVVSGRSIEWDGEAWGLPVPETATVTGTVYPGYRDYSQNSTLLDAVILDQTGREVTAPDSVFIRQLPAQVQLIPAEHRDDLRPETRTVAQVRLGDLIAEGGKRGEAVTELRFGNNSRRGSVMGFSTRDVATGAANGFALNFAEEVQIVPRERRAPQDVAAVFGRHSSRNQVALETQRTYDLHAAVTEVTTRVWPDGTGPQNEIRALSEAIGAIDAAPKGVDAYRANAAAMEAADAAAAALFTATDDDMLNGYVGLPLHRLRQHLDIQAQQLYADVAHLIERAAERAAAAPPAAADTSTADESAPPAPAEQGAQDQPAERTPEGNHVTSQGTGETEQLGLFGDPAQGPAEGPAEPETATSNGVAPADGPLAQSVTTEDERGAQLQAALIGGETLAPVSFTDQREPAAGWILTTAAGHTFRLRPVTFARPDEDQWEAGHDADGSYWWAVNTDARPLTAVLARIREDSATRTRFATLWARYGHLTAQAPQFETTTDRVQLEEGVYLVSRFGRIGLIASCRWGWEHLTDPDGAQGHTGEDWSRRGPDNRQYVAEWKIWHSAQDAIPNVRLRVVSQLTDDVDDTPDAYCDASQPYVGKCSAKRSGARYTVAVDTDQGSELGCYTVCARCLSHRLLDDENRQIEHHDARRLVEDLAKGDPKVVNLHWNQWPDRIAELAGQMLSTALDAGETAPWPAQALTSQILTEACEAGDDRAKREARAEVKAAGGAAKAQKRAADEAFAARQDRAALVARRGATSMDAANEADRVAVAILGLAGWGVEGSNAAPEPAEEAPVVVDVNTLTVSPQVRNGEPSSNHFTVTGPGLTLGEYEISHDAQGRGARGIMWRATWHGVEPSGRWDVIGIGSGKGESAALAAVAEHAAKTDGELAAGFTVARRMSYDAGLWVLPKVGESEAIQYHPDGSWTITAETGAPYTVRREWRGRDATNDLAPLLVEDQAGTLVASCTAVDGYMSAWAPMLDRLRLHAAAVADEVQHATAVTLGGPGRDWVEAWCVCSWTERADVAKYADRNPAGEALAMAHHSETSTADAAPQPLAPVVTPMLDDGVQTEPVETPAAAELPELNVRLLDVDVPPLDPAEPYSTDQEAQTDIDRLSAAFARWDALPPVQRYYDADRQQRPDGSGEPTNPVAQLAAAYQDTGQFLSDDPAGTPEDMVRQVHTVAVWSGALEPVVDEDLRGPLGDVREAAALLASRSQATVEAFEAELAALSTAPAEASPTAETGPAEQASVAVDIEPEALEDTSEPAADTGPAEPPAAAQTMVAPETDGAPDDNPAPDLQEAPEPPAAADTPENTAADSDPEPDRPDPQEPVVAVPDEGMHEARREVSFIEQDRSEASDGDHQQTPGPGTAASPPEPDPAPTSDETAQDASEEPPMTTPLIPETTDVPAPDEPATEEPPAPQRYFETVTLAGDPGYQLRLSGLDDQPVDSGDVLRGDIVIATVLSSGPDGGWFARLDDWLLPADITNRTDTPMEAAVNAAVMHSAFTGAPYGPAPGAAIGDGTRLRVDVLRAHLRDTAVQHRDTMARAAARAYPNSERNGHFRELTIQLNGLAAAVSEAHGSQQMTQHLDGIQRAVETWGRTLDTDPDDPERRELAYPLAHLLYDTRRMQDQVQATLAAVQAEQEISRAEAAAAAELNPSYLTDYQSGRPPRNEAAAAAYLEWQQLDAEDRQEALEAQALDSEFEPYKEPPSWDGVTSQTADVGEATAAATDDGPQQAAAESGSPEAPDSQSTGTAREEAPATPAEVTADVPGPEKPDGAAAPEGDGPALDATVDGILRAADQQPEPAAPEPGELPLWTGPDASPSDTAATETPTGPTDVRAEFQAALMDAWNEHVPPENGTAQDLFADLDADLTALQRAFNEAAAPHPPAEPSTAPDLADTATEEVTEAAAAAPVAQQASAVNDALQQADAHAATLQDFPEWQKIQTVRGAVGHLVRIMRERAGEHFDRLMGDSRVGKFFRKVSIKVCEKVAGWAQSAADRLRQRGEEKGSDAPAADALRDVADAASAYNSPGGGRSGPPPASRDTASATVDIPAMRQIGEALARPLPGSKDGRGARVSTVAARGKSTTRGTAKKPGGSTKKKPGAAAEQAGHLRRGGAEPQPRNKPTQR